MKSKTALQELLDWHYSQDRLFTNGKECITLESLFWKIQELLPKEKEQIETAFEDGVIDSQVEKFGFGEHYYTKTYKTDEK